MTSIWSTGPPNPFAPNILVLKTWVCLLASKLWVNLRGQVFVIVITGASSNLALWPKSDFDP